MKQFVSALAFFFLLLAGVPAAQAQVMPAFGPAWATNGSVAGWDIAAGDIDDDGNVDFAIARRPGTFQWYKGTGNGGFTLQQSWGGSRPFLGVALANFDNSVDGSLDVVFAGGYSNNDSCGTVTCQPTEVYLNTGTAFNTTAAWTDGLTDGSWGVATGDFNNDGWPDIVTSNLSGGSKIFLNNGVSGQGFGFTQTSYPGGAVQARTVATGELNGIPGDDIVFSDGTVLLSINGAPGTFTSSTLAAASEANIADLDADGDLDIIFAGSYGPIISHLNNGSGSFSQAANFGFDNNPMFDAAVGDINNDGFPDLMRSGFVINTSPFITTYLGDGDGTFTASNRFPGNSRGVTTADVDNDGDADVIASNNNFIYENDAALPSQVTNTNDSGPGSLRAAIEWANGNPNGTSRDTITFDIPGASTTHTIFLATELPVITDPVVIDASTQGDATCGSFGFGDRLLRVVIDGSALNTGGDVGFDVTSGNTIINGFVVQGMPQHGIRLGSSDNRVTCNYIGTDADGRGTSGANGRIFTGAGVFIEGSRNVVHENVVVASSYDEIRVEFGSDNTITDNYAGVDVDVIVRQSPLTQPNPGNENRIGIVSGTNGVVDGNVVGGFFESILLNDTATASNNRVGIGPGGESLPSTRGIIMFGNNGTAGPGNIISNNGVGVLVQNSSTGNRITQNSIFSNGADGIQLGAGSNGGILPLSWGAVYVDASGELTINVTAARGGTVELFKADSQVSGEGETFVSNLISYSTPGSEQLFNLGDASALGVSVGDILVATLTDGTGNTSVFSTAVPVAGDPLVVVNANDSGAGSLRAAIDYANATPNQGGPDVISFNIPGAGPHTIALASALPGISEAVTIDGYTQTDATANTTGAFQPFDADIRIRINGQGQGSGNGLTLSGTGSTVKGLVMYGFPGRALQLNGSLHTVQGNYIGTDGSTGLSMSGITLNGADMTVGGPNPADRNIITGGIGMEPAVTRPLIQGNYLGVRANGTQIFTEAGLRPTIMISSNQPTFVTVRENVIAGALSRGIEMTQANNSQADSNWLITNNRVGTDYTGDSTLPNGAWGIYLQKGANLNTISNNVIAGHSGPGIRVTDGDGLFSAQRVTISRNRMYNNGLPGIALLPNPHGNPDANDGIGTPSIGDARISLDGHLVVPVTFERDGKIEIFQADAASAEGERYFAESNVAGGFAVIVLTDLAATQIEASDALIVTLTDTAGNTSQFSAAVPVRQEILTVTSTANAGPGSLREAINTANLKPNGAGPDVITFDIAGPGPHVIQITSPLPALFDPVVIDGGDVCGGSVAEHAFNIVLEGDINGAGAAENGLVFVSSAAGSTVKGLVIHSFPLAGIAVDAADDMTIACNAIGVDADLVTPRDNGGEAVDALTGTDRLTLGGPAASDGNILASARGGKNVSLFGGTQNVVENNWIGVSPVNGSVLTPNIGVYEIAIGTGNGSQNILRSNVIGGASLQGVEVLSAESDLTIVSNFVGVTPEGDIVPNGAGIVFQGGSPTNVVFRNTIARNVGAGVRVDDFATNEIRVSENTMYENGGLGIELLNGSNEGASIPNLSSATRQASNLGFVSIAFQSALTETLDVEFFLADVTGSEGQTFLGRQSVAAGTQNLDVSYSGLIEAGDLILATATDADGNTSQFSNAVSVVQAANATILPDQIIVAGDALDFRISTSISGMPGMQDAIQAAFDAWDSVNTAEAASKATLVGTSPATEPALQDDINLITQSSDAFPLSVNTLAVASKLLAVAPSGDARILSADIVFNRDLLANPDEGLGTDQNPGIWDVQAVAMHEIGHTMGLRHSGIASSTMFFSIPSGKSYRSLEVDDKAWISYRYPSGLAASLGSIAGNVADGEGAVAGGNLGGVLIVARNTATGGRIHAYSDSDGDYLIPGVPAGDYEISIQPLDGFVDNIPGMVPGTVSPYLASITEYAQFAEEMWSGVDESGLETEDVAAVVSVAPGQDVTNIDFTTNLDNVAPTVNGASPSNLASDIRVNPSISVTFSEPVLAPGASALSIQLERVSDNSVITGTVQVPNAPSVVATFDLPVGTKLDYFTQYRIRVTGATDEKANVQTTAFTSTFTTRNEDQTAPNLLTSTPGNGGTDVAPNSTIALAFDEPMDFDSIQNGVTICVLDGGATCGAAVRGTWAFPRTSLAEALPQWVALFTPDNMLAESATYRIEVASTVKDQALGGGNAIGTVAPIEFSTVPDQVPTRVDFGPDLNATNQSVRLSVFADFSEPMVLPQTNGVNVGVTLTGAISGPVAGTVEVLNDGKRIVFRPDAPLAFFDNFTATFSPQITDATGNAIQGFSIPFQTASQPTAVTVATVSPLVAIPGSIVVFSGEGFNANPSLNSIQFTGASGTQIVGKIESSTLSTLTAVVPDGAISGPVTISAGGQSGSIELELYNVIPLVDPAIARKTAESAPRDVEVTPDGGTALVTNSGAGTVSILNVDDGSLRASITVGDSPLKVAINPQGTRAYVTNFGSNEISVLNIEDVNAPTLIKNIPVGLNPFGLAVSPDGKRLYVAEYTSKKITILDIEEGSSSADRAIARIGVEINDRNIEEEPDGGTRKLGVESSPRDIEVSPDGGSLFFTTETLGLRVLLLDENGSADEDAATRRITSESSTRDVELSPDGGLVFVTTLEGALEAYRVPPDLNSTSSFQAVARLGVESNSREVEVSPDGGLIYVTNFEQGLVQVYSITSLYTPSSNSATGGFALSFEPVTAYSVGENPEAVVFSATAQVALVANSGSDDVTVISFENEINSITDSDGDGLGDDEEGNLGTNPAAFDTDGDGLGDGAEVNDLLTDPTSPDSDGDGLSDGQEVNVTLSDPNKTDTDDDGLLDGEEVGVYLTSPILEDTDEDGLTDGEEVTTYSTDPTLPDTDGDGLTDGEEVSGGLTDVLDEDTDDDNRLDGVDLAPTDSTQWYKVNTVHDEREETVDELTVIVEDLTGAPVVIPDEGSSAAYQIDKPGSSDAKANPYVDRFDDELNGRRDGEVSVAKGKSSKKSDKSDKSDKSTKDNAEIADELFEALTELSWNTNPDKWINPLRPVRDEGNEIFNRDKDAIKTFEKVIDDVDEDTRDMLNRMTDSLVALDWTVARFTVTQATAACNGGKSCLKQAKKAEDDLEDAQEAIEDGDFDDAISEMRKAWNRMVKYLPEPGTNGKQVEALLASEDVEEEVAPELPTEFELSGNYPNPFNPTTTIEFALPEAVNVNLTVFDMLGRRVQVLVDRPMEAGTHAVRFDATSLPSGMYLYRIQAGQHYQVRTMMLIK